MSGNAALNGVLVTFRRPAALCVTLKQLAEQTRRLDRLVVVDNDADPRVSAVVAENDDAAGSVEYIAAPDNLGPAGGLALGTSQVLRSADDSDWIMFLDDDNPPRTADMFSEITAFAGEVLRQDPDMGGVGLIGARFDVRTGLSVRVTDQELRGPVQVEYVGGGQLPCFRAAAMRDVGLPDPRLFFGFDDLEYGLRLRAAGRQMYVNGELWHRERCTYGLIGIDRSPSRTIKSLGWRDYYSTRNLVWILRSNRRHTAAARVVGRRVLAKAIYNLPRSPLTAWAYVALGTRATFDAYAGRMGRTIDPTLGQAAS
jgi:glycosyltransferase involved in cell wall biosynthesis